MNGRQIFQSTLVALVLLCPAGVTAGAEQPGGRPNILWIIAEDMSPDLGCYGQELVKTPHIDRLAREGARFTHAFSASSLCAPSRSSFITGMYATSIGAHHQMLTRPAYSARFGHGDELPNNGVWLPEPVEPITWLLERAGYFTANVVDRKLRCNGKEHYNFNVKRPVWQSKQWSDLKSRQPFYGQVNFYLTHRIGIRNMESPETRPFSAPPRIDPSHVELPPYYPDHRAVRADWANYLDAVCALDAMVGGVVNRLKRDGLWEDTIVFFFSDHGRPMPRAKVWLYDAGLRVPLIVRVPAKWRERFDIQPGAVDDRLVCLIDLAATSLDIAGVAKPAWMQGRILFGPNREPGREYVAGTRDNLAGARMRNRTVRTRRFRYIRNFTPEVAYKDVTPPWNELRHPHWVYLRVLKNRGELTPEQASLLVDRLPEEELYDVEAEPFETRNLAGDPSHAEQLSRMRSTLEQWIESSGDRGDEPVDPDIIKASYRWERDLRDLYERAYYQPLKERGLPVFPFDEIAGGANGS